MLGQIGRNVLPFQSGYGAEVACGAKSEWMTVGATLDPALIPTSPAILTLPDTQVIPAGRQFYRFGQVLTRVTNAAAYVLTVTGSTFTVSVTVGGVTNTTAALPNTSTSLAIQNAVQALMNVGYGNISVTGPVGGPFNFNGPGVQAGTTLAATGGSFATGPGGNPGFFGPYDPNATDGRANLNRGDVGIVNKTILFGGSLNLPIVGDEYHLGLLVGGGVWGGKMLWVEGGTGNSLAAGPLKSALLAALPITPIYKQH